MSWNNIEILRRAWHPVATRMDLAAGHIFHGRLLGDELALWSDRLGRINAWENRCPHRGLRLTMGRHLGEHIECQYHGLRFESVTGQCTAVPAHPDLPPPRRMCVKSYATSEKYGWVWVSIDPRTDAPVIDELQDTDCSPLRSTIIQASHIDVIEKLARYQIKDIDGRWSAPTRVTAIGPFALMVQASSDTRILWVQPADLSKSIVHAAYVGSHTPPIINTVRRDHSEMMGEIVGWGT